MAAPVIQVEGLSKRFRVVHQASSLKRAAIDFLFNPRRRVDSFEALQDITFSINAGESVAIIGRNGSGKSTLLTLLAGIYRPSAGSITVRGRVGSLLDLYAGFHGEVTAEDNALIGAMIHGLSRREAVERVPQIIAYAGLGDFADTKIKHFSSGMTIRLGFSVIIHTDPDVLLVDEILAVGDEGFQRKSRESIEQFRRAGRTLVFVSHIVEAVEAVSERAIWLDGGRVRMDGPTAEVLPAYQAAARETADLAVPPGAR